VTTRLELCPPIGLVTVTVFLTAALAATPALADGEFAVPQPHLEWRSNSPSDRTALPDEVGTQKAEADKPVELTLDERRRIQARLKLRRKMVPIHQTLAFVTAGTIIAAEVVGLVNKVALETGRPKRADLNGSLILHRVLVTTATSTYLSTGIIAWTMPSAYQRQTKTKKKKADSGDAHVALSVVHGIAMGTVIATGLLQANAATGTTWDTLVGIHTAAGITAATAIVGAGIVIGTL